MSSAPKPGSPAAKRRATRQTLASEEAAHAGVSSPGSGPVASKGNAAPNPPSSANGANGAAPAAHRVLKKYPNRRLYDTHTSSYITLADVKGMVLQGMAFQVQDAKSGEEITRSILLQIILEEETDGVPMFSTAMLANLIRFYGHAMQGMMGHYLEANLQQFVDLQTAFQSQVAERMAGKPGLYDPSNFSPDAWRQWVGGQGLMGNLFPTPQKMFEQMQAGLAAMPGFKPPKA